MGFSTIGEVTYDSAAYVARYVLKKVTGEKGFHHYNTIDYATGEILQERRPEYVTMSRRPGIGYHWYQQFKNDVYPHDHVIHDAKKLKPPKYYDTQFELEYPSDFESIKARRKQRALHPDNNFERRLAGEYIKKQKIQFLNRSLDDEI